MAYPKIADLAADTIVVHRDNGVLKVLLIKRGKDPFLGSWALPGGFFELGESPEAAAIRELKEETSIELTRVSQFRTYGKPHRDPRGRVISVVHYAILATEPPVKAQDDAVDYGWFALSDLPPLAFDHAEILEDFRQFLGRSRDLRLAVKLLRLAADEFSNHGCNDFHLLKDGSLYPEESLELRKELRDWENDVLAPDLAPDRHYVQDDSLMSFVADQLLADTSTSGPALICDKSTPWDARQSKLLEEYAQELWALLASEFKVPVKYDHWYFYFEVQGKPIELNFIAGLPGNMKCEGPGLQIKEFSIRNKTPKQVVEYLLMNIGLPF